MLRHVDLCSGIGGFALGFEWAKLSTPVQFCDIEPWSRKILAQHWPHVPIATDVKELANDPERLVRECDIITAGYPCQPFSVAGRQKGEEDPRHIYPYISKIIASKRPSWVVFENVGGHIALGLDKVLADLALKDYATRVFVIPAAAIGAPHRRDRLWVIGRNVGDSKHNGSSATEIGGINEENAGRSSEGKDQTEQSQGASGRGNNEYVPDSKSQQRNERHSGIITQKSGQSGLRIETGTSSGNVAHTISNSQRSAQGINQGGSEREWENQNISKGNQVRGNSGNSSGESRGTQSNVSNTESQRTGKDNEGLWSGSGRASGGEGTTFTYTISEGLEGWIGNDSGTGGEILSDIKHNRHEMGSETRRSGRPSEQTIGEKWWAIEPNVGRVAYGIPKRVDRIKGLGNAILPQISMQIGLAIKKEIEK
jgi:DNA (cytosine-5)-methyltransferase 1